MPYASLSLKQKKELRDEKSTISRIIQESCNTDVLDIPKAISKGTRNRTGANPKLEAALFAWICDQANLRRMINGCIIREKAGRLQALCNESLPTTEKITMQFSDGWMANFKRRWNLKSLKAHGESGDADQGAVQASLGPLCDRIAQYSHKDVFNADECGLFYKLAPDSTVATARPLGRKKMKDRITVLVCANADGSEKFELMFIGTALRPRPFKKKYGKEYGLDYHANKKAWMTGELFKGWLDRFNSYFKERNRKVLLLVDNCSAHGNATIFPAFSNVELVFLPPNTTSKLQPCDAGIIASMKVRYRSFQMERALDLAEEESVLDIYKVDILSAMLAFKRIWNALSSSSIANCWKHTGLLGTVAEAGGGVSGHPDGRGDLQALLNQLVPTTSRISISDLLNLDGEDDCIQVATDSNLVEQVIDEGCDQTSEDYSDDNAEEAIPLPSFKKQLGALSLCKRMCEFYDVPDSFRGQLAKLQRVVRCERSNSAQQMTLDQFF
eukprot:IDg2433t1